MRQRSYYIGINNSTRFMSLWKDSIGTTLPTLPFLLPGQGCLSNFASGAAFCLRGPKGRAENAISMSSECDSITATPVVTSHEGSQIPRDRLVTVIRFSKL